MPKRGKKQAQKTGKKQSLSGGGPAKKPATRQVTLDSGGSGGNSKNDQ